jgi:2-dehydro-3-deoxygluconokinase
MSKVVTFGEIMVRLSPPGFKRFAQAKKFEVEYGGAEANVAVSLAVFGEESHFVSRLPDHDIGQAALNAVRKHGVRSQHILRGGDRMGLYFLETGVGLRASKVIYDRADSAICDLKPGMIDWETVFIDADWFHWTGITPALAPNLQEVTKEACLAARNLGVTVSCDLNNRRKLWTKEEARKAMVPLMEYVDVCFANQWAADDCLDFRLESDAPPASPMNLEDQFRLADSLKRQFNFRAVAITLRELYSASRNGLSAILLDEKECREPIRSSQYEIEIVDRVGGGDAFAAGLIYGLLNLENSSDALEFAVAASVLKHSINGDVNLVSVQDVKNLVQSKGDARVDR